MISMLKDVTLNSEERVTIPATLRDELMTLFLFKSLITLPPISGSNEAPIIVTLSRIEFGCVMTMIASLVFTV